MEVTVQGIVMEVYRKGTGCSFELLAPNMNKRFTCSINSFCPLDTSDVIQAPATIRHEKSGMVLVLKQRPILELPTKPEVIVEKIMEALTYKKGRFSADKAWNLYDYLAMQGKEGETPTETLDRVLLQCNKFGGTLLDKIELKPWQKRKLVTWWYKSRILRPLYMLGLTKGELSDNELLGLYDKVRANPYTVPSIPLHKCRDVVQQMGLSLGPEEEECGKIVRFIYDKMKKGWTGVPSSIVTKEFPGSSTLMPILKERYGIVGKYRTIYLDYAYKAESFIVDLVQREREIIPTEPHKSDSLCQEQLEAIDLALSHDFSIITGGPGTGKTTLLKELVDIYKKKGREEGILELVSFTGKAVSRIREVTKGRASTLHQLIHNGDPDKKIAHLIVDEASMVSVNLLYQVLSKYHPKRLTLIGDRDQLETIEWGNMLDPLIKSGKVPTKVLTKNHRADEGLIRNLMMIASIPHDLEDVPEAPELVECDNFTILKGDINMVESLMSLLKESDIGVEQFKVITPYNKDVDTINKTAQALFNPQPTPHKFRVGDLVMMTDNRYDIDVMNGQEGVVTGVGENIKVKFREREISFPLFTYDEDGLSAELLVLSYAITVHRAQGSEWDIIIFYVPQDAKDYFVNRRLVYTALSRAKKQVYYVGDSRSSYRGLCHGSSYRCNNLLVRLS